MQLSCTHSLVSGKISFERKMLPIKLVGLGLLNKDWMKGLLSVEQFKTDTANSGLQIGIKHMV